MAKQTICKTVHQYNREPVSEDDMEKLIQIASDCSRVKAYVYQCYGGIKSLSKLYPGYTVQNEMIETKLREELGLPFVYFNLAVFDALSDIKIQWTNTKAGIGSLIKKHSDFTEADRHYLNFLLKVNSAFDAVLNQQEVRLKKDFQKQYEELACNVEKDRLDRYLCRQVRKMYARPQNPSANGFSLTERAYRYADHGIYITMKEKRKRIFIPLTDNNRYTRQIFLHLFEKEGNIEIQVPVDVEVKRHEDYVNEVGLAVGMRVMFTTNTGHAYGDQLEERQTALSGYVRQQNTKYAKNRSQNVGRKKYYDKRHCLEEQLHSYINKEINRFLQTEKPAVIYVAKLPKPAKHSGNKTINYSVAAWQRGYIRNRLKQKCSEHAVNMVEVFGKDISSQCSQCGALGKKENGMFFCSSCQAKLPEKENTAKNALERGRRGTNVSLITVHKGTDLEYADNEKENMDINHNK